MLGLRMRKYLFIGFTALVLAVICGALFWTTQDRLSDSNQSYLRGLAAVKSRDVIALHREIQILRRDPLFVHQMELLRGTVLLEGGDYQSALAEFVKGFHDPATQTIALTLAGEVLCRTERQGDAIPVLERALDLDPESVEGYRWLAIACYDTGANAQAVTALKKLVHLIPNDFRPRRLLGLIQKDRSRYSEAVQEYRACLRLKPGDERIKNEILYELSDCLTQLNRYDDALQFLDEAEETADIQALRAHCYFGKGNRDAARRAAERAIELEPDHVEGQGWLGTLDLESGKYASAAGHLEKVVKHYPAEFAPRFKLSQAYQRLGRKSEAEENLALAKKYQALGQKFTELHEKANEKPKDPGVRLELGNTARELGRTELARMWFKATLALDPNSVEAINALKQLPPAPAQNPRQRQSLR